MLFTSPPGLYMVGQKGDKGQPGIPGRCGCNAPSSVNPSFDQHLHRGIYPRVPAVSHQWQHGLQTKPEYYRISVHLNGSIVFALYSILGP